MSPAEGFWLFLMVIVAIIIHVEGWRDDNERLSVCDGCGYCKAELAKRRQP